MATTKKDASKSAVAVKVLRAELHAEIIALKNAASSIVRREGETVEIAAAKIDRAVDLLTMSRALVRSVDKEYKELVAPFEKLIAPFNNERKAINKSAELIASEVETGLYGLIESGDLRAEGHESKSGCRLTLVRRDGSPEVKEVRRVPKSYLLPPETRVDMKAVTEAYAEAKKRGDKDFSIPGIELSADTYTFRTTLPDYVEN